MLLHDILRDFQTSLPPLSADPCALISLIYAANMLNSQEDLRALPFTWMGYEMVAKGIKHSDIQVMSCEHVIVYMHLHNLTFKQNGYIHYINIYKHLHDHYIVMLITWHVISSNYMMKYYDYMIITRNYMIM